MENKIAKLIKLVQKLPENCLDEAIEYIEEKLEEEMTDEPELPCPECNSKDIQHYGKKGEKQRYRCKSCKKIYTKSTNTSISHSHYGEAIWKQVIQDTVEDVPLSKTATKLEMSESTAFRMRHKILMALEAEEGISPAVMSGVCELDDTFVLESLKGSKLPDTYWRKPRKHGAVAQKRGISNEYVCISTGIQRDGAAYAQAITRATPHPSDVVTVFGELIESESLILCDGTMTYDDLGEHCNSTVMNVTRDSKGGKGFFNINTVNNFHGFIKNKLQKYRGVATKYLNRYNAFFSRAYRSDDDLVDSIYSILMTNDGRRCHDVNDVRVLNLLNI